MKIRRAVLDDAKNICEISKNDLGYECDIDLVKERITSLDSSRECVLVAELNNSVVGYVHVEKYNTLYYESMINILGLAVDVNYQRRGIGRALMEAAENWGKEQGISKARLNSGASRKSAHEFYRAIGYNSEKEQIRFMKNI